MQTGALITTLLTLALTSPLALADRGHHRDDRHRSHYDYGRVIHAEPIYHTRHRRVAEQHCWMETQAVEHSRRSSAAPVVGGVMGAAIGNRLGRGNREKSVSTVAGAIIGAAIASDMSRDRHPTTTRLRDVERCETRYQRRPQRQLVGYDVTYKYRGRTYQTRTDNHPGKRIKLSVDARPVGY